MLTQSLRGNSMGLVADKLAEVLIKEGLLPKDYKTKSQQKKKGS